MKFHAYAAEHAKDELKPFEYDPGELGERQVQIKVERCGICHSDSTVNATLPWDKYLNALGPRGRLHLVGAVKEPLSIPVFGLLGGQKSVSASPLGSPATIRKMLEFCVRHQIAPKIKTYPFSEVNKALAELADRQPAHRLVLTHG